jgi:endo-1,4-beta-xylanase
MTASPLARRTLLAGTAAGLAAGALTSPARAASARPHGHHGHHAHDRDPDPTPLWQVAVAKGLIFGSSIASWQLDDTYPALHAREAALLWPEDDLLWYQLKPTPTSPLDFTAGDTMIDFAETNGQLTVSGFLVWDEGFGDGWTDDDLWGLTKQQAKKLLYGVVRKEVAHYRGRMNGWIVANEVTDPNDGDSNGFRTNVPWYSTIGPGYIGECFHLAEDGDPGALRLINEFGFETVNQYGDKAEARRKAFLKALDTLLGQGVPVQGVGVQAHLLADGFADKFHPHGYRQFLGDIADRGMPIFITELDVLDDGLPTNIAVRDQGVADVYSRYLDVALDEPAVKVVNAFGLTDRYTWLDEDMPRDDGAHRRPLAYDRMLRPTPAHDAISQALAGAPVRPQLWPLAR